MNRRALVIVGLAVAQQLIIGGCAMSTEMGDEQMDETSRLSSLEFLTREGCANTPVMRKNLDAALSELGVTAGYKAVDVSAVPASDYRRGYGTPTVLVNGSDLMGMQKQPPSAAEPG